MSECIGGPFSKTKANPSETKHQKQQQKPANLTAAQFASTEHRSATFLAQESGDSAPSSGPRPAGHLGLAQGSRRLVLLGMHGAQPATSPAIVLRKCHVPRDADLAPFPGQAPSSPWQEVSLSARSPGQARVGWPLVTSQHSPYPGREARVPQAPHCQGVKAPLCFHLGNQV